MRKEERWNRDCSSWCSSCIWRWYRYILQQPSGENVGRESCAETEKVDRDCPSQRLSTPSLRDREVLSRTAQQVAACKCRRCASWRPCTDQAAARTPPHPALHPHVSPATLLHCVTTMVEQVLEKILWTGRHRVKQWWKVIAVCCLLNRHVQIKGADRGMNN